MHGLWIADRLCIGVRGHGNSMIWYVGQAEIAAAIPDDYCAAQKGIQDCENARIMPVVCIMARRLP